MLVLFKKIRKALQNIMVSEAPDLGTNRPVSGSSQSDLKQTPRRIHLHTKTSANGYKHTVHKSVDAARNYWLKESAQGDCIALLDVDDPTGQPSLNMSSVNFESLTYVSEVVVTNIARQILSLEDITIPKPTNKIKTQPVYTIERNWESITEPQTPKQSRLTPTSNPSSSQTRSKQVNGAQTKQSQSNQSGAKKRGRPSKSQASQSGTQSKTQSKTQSGSKSKGKVVDPTEKARKASETIQGYSIDELEIGSGTKQALKSAGFSTIQSLANANIQRIHNVRNIGPSTITRIAESIDTLIKKENDQVANSNAAKETAE